jgi:hypothetical protein
MGLNDYPVTSEPMAVAAGMLSFWISYKS